MNINRMLLKASQSTSTLFTRNYAFKTELKIKWAKPEKIACYLPAKSGDLKPKPQMDNKRYAYEFRNCKELEDADENVKKLFSLEFSPRRKHTELYVKDMSSVVKRHGQDWGSMESKLARWTAVIRSMQEQVGLDPKNIRLRVALKELIDKRKKHLKYLRRWDYKRFEWLLEALDLVYKPAPLGLKKVSRKESFRKITDKYCEDIIEDQLNAYKLHLQDKQPAFLEEKLSILKHLQNEQKECNVEVTIKDEDIEAVQNQLANLLKEKTTKEDES